MPLWHATMTLLGILGTIVSSFQKMVPISLQEMEEIKFSDNIPGQTTDTRQNRVSGAVRWDQENDICSLTSKRLFLSSSPDKVIVLVPTLADFKAFQELLLRIADMLDIKTLMIQEKPHKLFNILTALDSARIALLINDKYTTQLKIYGRKLPPFLTQQKGLRNGTKSHRKGLNIFLSPH